VVAVVFPVVVRIEEEKEAWLAGVCRVDEGVGRGSARGVEGLGMQSSGKETVLVLGSSS
jgi:hypothetical protein